MKKNKLKQLNMAVMFSIFSMSLTPAIAAEISEQPTPGTVTIQEGNQITLPPLTLVVTTEQLNDSGIRKKLTDVGCDPSVMQRLNNVYLNTRGLQRNLELQTLVGEQAVKTPAAAGSKPGPAGANGVPGPSVGSCFQNAAGQINTAVSAVNNVLSVLSGGGFNTSAAVAAAAKYAQNAACQQINTTTGQMVGGYTNQVTGTIAQGTGGVLNNSVGGYSAGQVLQSGSSPSTATGATVPYVNTDSCTLLTCNPFK